MSESTNSPEENIIRLPKTREGGIHWLNRLKKQEKQAEKTGGELLPFHLRNQEARDMAAIQLQKDNEHKKRLTAELELEKQKKTAEIAIELAAEAQIDSMIDPLTGLHNRRWFNEELVRKIKEADRTSQTLIVGNIDLDNFKGFNENFGHETGGDPALQSLANLPFRKETPIARVGGDEFAQAIGNTSIEDIEVLSSRYNEKMYEVGHLLFDKAPKQKSDYPIPENLSLSMGWAVYQGEAADDLKVKADLALQEAKRLGKGCAVIAVVEDGILRLKKLDPAQETRQMDSAA